VAVADDENAKVTLRALQTAKGRLQFSSWKGRVVLRKWPRPRGKNISANQRAWVDKFAAVSRATKTPSPQDLENSIELAKGTGWYYRDVLAVAMNGKLWTDFGEQKIKTPTVSVTRAAAESKTATIWHTLTPNVQQWNNNDFWNAGVNPSRVTVRSSGLYLLIGRYKLSGASSEGSAKIRFRVNGTDPILENSERVWRSNGETPQTIGIWYFNPDDYVEMQAFLHDWTAGCQITAFQLLAITPEGIVP